MCIWCPTSPSTKPRLLLLHGFGGDTILPARIRSAAASSSSPHRPFFKCISATNANSTSLSSTSRPVVDGVVGSADLTSLQAPPVLVLGTPVPAYRDPHGLPRRLTSADLMGTNAEGLKVAYQGFPGAYSEAAAKKAYPNCQTMPCEHFDIAFQAVENWVVDRAVLPLENTLGGSIHRNYDLLLRHGLHIVGEVRLAVRHCLLANRGVKIGNLSSVTSHPQDEKVNVTRFMMLAREPIIPRTDKSFKTSIVFSLEEGPGQLFKALAVFAPRDINLTKIESRPHKKRPLRIADDTFSTPVKSSFHLKPDGRLRTPRQVDGSHVASILLERV